MSEEAGSGSGDYASAVTFFQSAPDLQRDDSLEGASPTKRKLTPLPHIKTARKVAKAFVEVGLAKDLGAAEGTVSRLDSTEEVDEIREVSDGTQYASASAGDFSVPGAEKLRATPPIDTDVPRPIMSRHDLLEVTPSSVASPSSEHWEEGKGGASPRTASMAQVGQMEPTAPAMMMETMQSLHGDHRSKSDITDDKLRGRQYTDATDLGPRKDREFPMPSDEEVKEFCLATGGGFGVVDPTEKVFFVAGKRYRTHDAPEYSGGRGTRTGMRGFIHRARNGKVVPEKEEAKINARQAPLQRTNQGPRALHPAGDARAPGKLGVFVLSISIPSTWTAGILHLTLTTHRRASPEEAGVALDSSDARAEKLGVTVDPSDVWCRELSKVDADDQKGEQKGEQKGDVQWATRSCHVAAPDIPQEKLGERVVWRRVAEDDKEQDREKMHLTLNLANHALHPDPSAASGGGGSRSGGGGGSRAGAEDRDRARSSKSPDRSLQSPPGAKVVMLQLGLLRTLHPLDTQDTLVVEVKKKDKQAPPTKVQLPILKHRWLGATPPKEATGQDGEKPAEAALDANPEKADAEAWGKGDANAEKTVLPPGAKNLVSVRGYYKAPPVDLDSAFMSALDPDLKPGHAMVVGAGRLTWMTKWQEDRAPYVRVSTPSKLDLNGGSTLETRPPPDTPGVDAPKSQPARPAQPGGFHYTNPHLLRFLIEHVWMVERPELLITVTGGAEDFHLPAKRMELLMQGLTEAAKTMDAWFLSGGSDVGIMKHIGEARNKYSIKTPLIGIATWGVVKGRHMMVREPVTQGSPPIRESMAVDYEKATKDMEVLEESRQINGEGAPSKSVNLNHNHSHFIFAHDGSSGEFGAETALRGHLEACMAHSQDATEAVLHSLERQGLGWQGMNITGVQNAARRPASAIPAVCVCVEGGPGTAATVHAAVSNDTPVLLVRGSGRAADLLADAVLADPFNSEEDGGANLAPLRAALIWVKQGMTMERDKSSLSRFASSIPDSPLQGDQQGSGRDENLSASPPDCKAILEQYRLVSEKDKEGAHVRLLEQVVRCVESNLCTVFDLDGDEANSDTLNGALLKCIINGYKRRVEKKTLTQEKRVKRTLRLVVSWGRVDVLQEVLKTLIIDEKNKHSKTVIKSAMQDALVDALGYGFAEIVESLIDFGADLHVLHVDQIQLWEELRLELELEHGATKNASYFASINVAGTNSLPTNLASITLPQDGHSPYSEEDGGEGEEGGLHNIRKEDNLAASGRWRQLMRIVEQEQGQEAIIFSGVKERAKRALESVKHNSRHGKIFKALIKRQEAKDNADGSESRILVGRELSRDDLRGLQNLLWIDTIFVDLLGEDFRFNLGVLGAEWDLLLIAAILGRQELAVYMWGQCRYPITAALTVCNIYHNMSHKYSKDPDERDALKRNKHEFEQLAIRVYNKAYRENPRMSLEGLEAPIGVWNSRTAFDVAFMGDCRHFVHKCCGQASDLRWGGDLAPFQRGGVLWLEPMVFLCIFPGFFFLAPFVLEFNNPPAAKSLRAPAQRRKSPQGYPHRPFANVELRKLFQATKADWGKHRLLDLARRAAAPNPEGGAGTSRVDADAPGGAAAADEASPGWGGRLRRAMVARRMVRPRWYVLMQRLQKNPATAALLTPAELSVLWAPTFSYWERLKCFGMAPVSIFMLNSMIFITVVLMLTSHVMAASWRRRTGAEMDEITLEENVFAFWAAASVANELLQISEDGATGYFRNIWNVVDVCSLSLFWAGYILRNMCLAGACWNIFTFTNVKMIPQYLVDLVTDPANIPGEVKEALQESTYQWERGISLEGLGRQLYGLACLFFWLRFLHLYSINATLGPLVLAIRRMGGPIVTFMFVLMVVLVGFAVAIDSGSTHTECLESSDPQALHAFCMGSWWFLRTYFQSFGEMFLDTLNDDVSVWVFVIAMWALQLILMNTVFVAMITSTYEETLSKSREEWMMDMYQVTDSYMNFFYALPVPMIPIITVPIVMLRKHLNEDKVKLQQEHEKQAGLNMTSHSKLMKRLMNPRYTPFSVLPPELKQQITQRHREEEVHRIAALKGQAGEQERAHQAFRRRVHVEDTRTLQKWQAIMNCEALQQRAQALVLRRKRAEKQDKEQASLRILRLDDKVDALQKVQAKILEDQSKILEILREKSAGGPAS